MIPSFRESNSSGRRHRRTLGAIAAGLTATAMFLATGSASAQTTPSEAVQPTGKGIVGGALLGGEVVDLTLGIVGVNRGWPYLVFGALGAVGGGIGGYFVEQNTATMPEVDAYMLAGGMALVIPTLVVSLNATMYRPPEVTSEPANNQPSTGPAPAPMPSPGAAPVQTRRTLQRPNEHFAFSLVDVYKGAVAMGIPAVQVKPLYSQREVWTYNVQQGSEVRVPLFYATF
ncbi:MAG: hypothetical protein U0441_30895 [Polyangiaceae bacterium]